ncbi:MAG: putative rane protein [Glaciihabitans sp.]|nr:putative rane protein [Glaciihabitans sp.]
MDRRPETRSGGDPALGLLAVLMTALFGGITYLALILVAHNQVTAELLAGCALIGLGVSLAATGAIAFQRRRALTHITTDDITAVIKLGALPGYSNTRRWGELLQHRRNRDQRVRWLAPLLAVPLAAGAMAAALSDIPHVFVWWPLVGMFLVVGGWGAVSARQEIPRIDRMLADIEAGEADEARKTAGATAVGGAADGGAAVADGRARERAGERARRTGSGGGESRHR